MVTLPSDAANSARKSLLKSQGVIAFQGSNGKKVNIDSSDLVTLANQIDSLENTYKSKSVDALNSIGTYIDDSGNVNHNGIQSSSLPTFESIYKGIKKSQETQGSDVAIVANNLPSGKAAWVNGKYIRGNNHDLDQLRDTWRNAAVGALGQIGTYVNSSGNRTTKSAEAASNLANLTPEKLQTIIKQSQNVNSGNSAMTADNLPVGKAGWVNGNYVIGNGTDINNAYNQGYQAGLNYMTQNTSISYTYHSHTGSQSSGGGCYTTPVRHQHSGSPTVYGGCYVVPVYHQHSGSPSSGGGCYGGSPYHQHTASCYQPCHVHQQHCVSGGWYHDWDCSSDGSGCPSHPKYDYCQGELNSEEIVCGLEQGDYVGYTLQCGKTAGSTVDYYNPGCGRTAGVTIDKYTLGCGKTTSTIETAYIVFP